MALPEGVSGSSEGEGLRGSMQASRSENRKIIANNMIVTVIIVLLVLLFAGSIESNLMDAFSGDWMQFDDPQDPKESNVEMDNSEFDWDHNVKHRTEEDYA